MFSQTTEYALRAMVVLAKDPKKSWKTKDLAQVTQIPTDYLSKVLQKLNLNKLVVSRRGLKGGISIEMPVKIITIFDIINAVDPILRIKKCPLNLKTHGLNLCPLHKKLDHVISYMENTFRSTTLSELVEVPQNPLGQVGLCKLSK